MTNASERKNMKDLESIAEVILSPLKLPDNSQQHSPIKMQESRNVITSGEATLPSSIEKPVIKLEKLNPLKLRNRKRSLA
jgi:hypothetical protein